MSNVGRSRSPRYSREHSFSMNSLNNANFNDAHTAYYPSRRQQSKTERGKRNNSREQLKERDTLHEKEHNRLKSTERNENYSEYEKYRKNEQFRDNRGESPEEESYLKSDSSFRYQDHPIKTINTEKHGNLEECMLDPSTCNFRGTTFPTEDNNILVQEEPVRIEERKTTRDDTDNRLERLEKLVERLVNNNASKSQLGQVNISQEGSWFSGNKGVLELVPRDSNFTTSMWLNKLHEECIERNFDEKTSIQFLENNMTGIIKAWYKTIPSYDFTWPELKMLITKTFPDNSDFAFTLKLLVARKKKLEESVTQYYFSKMYLLEACKISGANAVSCLIDGLENESFRQEAKSHNFLTPEALYSQFLLKCSFYHNDQGIPEIIEYEQNYTAELDHTENKPKEDIYKIEKVNVKKCFTCGKHNHLTIDCRHAPRCYSCKREGHIVANCPLKYRKVLMISSKKEHDKSDFVLCYVNGEKLYAYIDTGCDIITIRECVAKDLKLKYNPSQLVIQGYGGGVVRALGDVKLELKVDLIECTLPAVVVPDDIQTVPLIIGQPLLCKQDVVMVWQNSKISLFENNLYEFYLKTKVNSLQEDQYVKYL